jgi:hypothetical protein
MQSHFFSNKPLLSHFLLDMLKLEPINYSRFFNINVGKAVTTASNPSAPADSSLQTHLMVVDLEPYSHVTAFVFVNIASILGKVGGLYSIFGLILSIVFTKYVTSQLMISIAKVVKNDHNKEDVAELPSVIR